MQVRHLYVVLSEAPRVETETEQTTDVGRERAQALAGGLTGNFSFYKFLLLNLEYLLQH